MGWTMKWKIVLSLLVVCLIPAFGKENDLLCFANGDDFEPGFLWLWSETNDKFDEEGPQVRSLFDGSVEQLKSISPDSVFRKLLQCKHPSNFGIQYLKSDRSEKRIDLAEAFSGKPEEVPRSEGFRFTTRGNKSPRSVDVVLGNGLTEGSVFVRGFKEGKQLKGTDLLRDCIVVSRQLRRKGSQLILRALAELDYGHSIWQCALPEIYESANFQKLVPRYTNIERFLDWVCFNLVIGNNDSHSKNISLLLQQKAKYVLTPFYDLMSTAIYERLESSFSFRIGDRDEFSKIGKNQIELLEDQLGLKRNVFKKRLQGMVDQILAQYKPLADQIHEQFPKAKILKRINELIDARIKSLKFQKALS